MSDTDSDPVFFDEDQYTSIVFDEESSAESTIFLEDEHCSSIEEMSTTTSSGTDDSFFVGDDDPISIESSDEMEEEISEKVDKSIVRIIKKTTKEHINKQKHKIILAINQLLTKRYGFEENVDSFGGPSIESTGSESLTSGAGTTVPMPSGVDTTDIGIPSQHITDLNQLFYVSTPTIN